MDQSSAAMFPDLLRDDVFRLETARLWLRWPRASDAAEIVRLAGDPEVALATARIPHPYPPEAATAYVLQTRRDNAEGRSATFMLAAKRRPGLAIGAVGLLGVGEERLSLGYWLGKPHWRQGLMTEATHAVVDLAFTWTGTREIIAATQAINSASQKVLEKCGFQCVGEALESAPARAGSRLAKRFSLTREQWTGFVGAAAAPSQLELR